MHKLTWILSIMLLVLLPAWSAAAQETPRPDGYFLSPDASGLWQVWRLAGGQAQAEQITRAAASVADFAIAPDTGGLAYSSAGQLWLQRFGGEPVSLVTLTSDPAAHPIFNLDGSQIAYADAGIWLVGAGNGAAPRQVFSDPVPGRATPDAYPFYQPQRFIGANTLLVDVGVWEGNTFGLLDLNSGVMRELEPGVHTDALPLDDGRLLLFGNSATSGEFNIQVAPMNDLSQRETLVDLSAYSPDKPLFVDQAVLIAPNTVRIFGTTFESAPEYRPLSFWLTLDIAARQVTSVEPGLLALPASTAGQTLPGPATPDGTLLAILLNAENRPDAGAYGLMAGTLSLTRFIGGDSRLDVSPAPAAAFQWGPVGTRG